MERIKYYENDSNCWNVKQKYAYLFDSTEEAIAYNEKYFIQNDYSEIKTDVMGYDPDTSTCENGYRDTLERYDFFIVVTKADDEEEEIIIAIEKKWEVWQGRNKFVVSGILREAEEEADRLCDMEATDLIICDQSGEEVARRCYFAGEFEEGADNPIEFGYWGYFGDWCYR